MSAFGAVPKLGRRTFVAWLALGSVCFSRFAKAMGQSGAFSARRLTTSRQRQELDRDSGLSRWGWELVRRTSAPANLEPTLVPADSPRLLAEPFVVWAGDEDPGPLTLAERRGIESFLRLGGIMVVDDSRPDIGAFGTAARRELRRILPETSPVALDAHSVIFRSFYVVRHPLGRVSGVRHVDSIVRGRLPQILFLSCDLLGALATRSDGTFRYALEQGQSQQREYAIRFAVNIAMYVLCSDYKDDQVHAEWLMRHRARWNR